MKVWLSAIALLLLVGVVLGAHRAGAAVAQDSDDLEATLAALETQVAAVETQIAESEADTDDDDEPLGTPGTGVGDVAGPHSAIGPAAELMAEGEPGELAVVAVGDYDGRRMPFVVRNNTSESVEDVQVTATVRGGGDLLGAGSSLTVGPAELAPRGLLVGYLYFDGIEFPPDAEYELEVDGSAVEDSSFRRHDLVVVEAASLPDRIVGEALTDTDEVLSSPNVVGMCVAEDGSSIAFVETYVDADEVEPGDAAAFQITLSGIESCPLFLVAASAYPA